VSGVRQRVADAVALWRGRELTSGRLMATAVGFLAVILPVALFYVVVGPTAGDRLVALAFAVGAVALGLYSLWEAKAPGPREGRPGRSIDDP
jgi:hypothetical protein